MPTIPVAAREFGAQAAQPTSPNGLYVGIAPVAARLEPASRKAVLRVNLSLSPPTYPEKPSYCPEPGRGAAGPDPARRPVSGDVLTDGIKQAFLPKRCPRGLSPDSEVDLELN
jgi:hypothetical protein